MNYKILFTNQAAEQLQDSFDWYETQRQLLGWEFREEFSDVVDKITNDKVAYKVFWNDVRKITLKRFPYHVYFQKEEKKKEILIVAILHQKRSPKEIKALIAIL